MAVLIDCLPKLERCCCCHNVRTGSLILGWIMLVMNTLRLIFSIIYFSRSNTYPGKAKFNYMFLAITKYKSDDDDEFLNSSGAAMLDVLSTLLWVVFSIILLVGIYKENETMVLAYLYFVYVCIAMGVITLVVYIILSFKYAVAPEEVVAVSIFFIITTALDFYFLAVVASYYKELVEEREGSFDEL